MALHILDHQVAMVASAEAAVEQLEQLQVAPVLITEQQAVVVTQAPGHKHQAVPVAQIQVVAAVAEVIIILILMAA
mgnify:CR=1 FL=1